MKERFLEMNGKSRNMDYKFAIKVLNSAKVETPSMHGNPKHYSYRYQNQTFYDIARNMAIQALKEKYEINKPVTNYDHIKAMNIEEMAEYIVKNFVCECYFGCPDCLPVDDYDIKTVYNMLKSEVSE